MAEDKKRAWIDTVAKLLIPIVIFALGQQYAHNKDVSDRQQRQFDRDAELLKSMASKDENEKVLTLQFIDYLRRHDQFPQELWVVVQTTAAGNRDNPSTQTAQLILHNTAEQDTSLTKQFQQTAQTIPTRVYIQYQNVSQRDSAQRLRTSLQDSGFVAPGLEMRPKESPARTEIRYFSSSDKDQADQVRQIVQKLGLTAEERDFSAKYGGKVPLRQLEVWLGGQDGGAGRNAR